MDVIIVAILAAVAVYIIWPKRDVDELEVPADAGIEPTPKVTEEDIKQSDVLPDFGKMTKVAIETWARENIELELDRRKTKANMIADIHAHFSEL